MREAQKSKFKMAFSFLEEFLSRYRFDAFDSEI